ncbi:hypothetical protein JCM33374_g3598 [Metschnikowia sp. JCM 33374]|nr:hypothetical protein JCM33374_g3598 [Metschnikowia sp. JCM 33374]
MDPPSTPSSPDLSYSDFDGPTQRHVLDGSESPMTSPYSDTNESTMDSRTHQGLSEFRQNQLMDLHPHTFEDVGASLEKTPVVFYSSASESESQSPTRLKNARRHKIADGSSVSPSTSPRTRKSVRRKSRTASEVASEKSHRSEFQQGGGYTSTPATGKIFRNLLILEESLRQQVAQQRTLRRKYLTFLALLCSLIASISYHLYFASSSGAVRVFLQLILLMLVVTLLLYHLSGEYQKTIVLPRKFLSSTNKGLRQLNVRLIRTKSSLTNRTADLARELGLFLCTMALKFCHSVSPSMVRNPASKVEVWLVSVQSRCQPRFGLNDIKLVLVPRSFNTDIREGWELYRDEFWIKEGIRRRDYLLDFTRPTMDPDKKGIKKDKKERRKRKSSLAQRPNINEQSLETLDSMSPEPSPQPTER